MLCDFCDNVGAGYCRRADGDAVLIGDEENTIELDPIAGGAWRLLDGKSLPGGYPVLLTA